VIWLSDDSRSAVLKLKGLDAQILIPRTRLDSKWLKTRTSPTLPLCIKTKKSKFNFNCTINSHEQGRDLKCLDTRHSNNIMLWVECNTHTKNYRCTVHLCARVRSVLNFHTTFLKLLHDEKPSKEHANRAMAIQHSEWREFMSSRQTRDIKCSECLEETGCTYIMQWNTAQAFGAKRI